MWKTKCLAIVLLIAVFTCFHTELIYGANFLDDIFSSGNNFFNQGANSGDPLAPSIKNQILEGGLNLKGLIQTVGNAAIMIITVILGAKYIWAGVDGKAQIKDSLPAYVLGVLFFYLAEGLTTFFQKNVGNTLQGTTSTDNLIGTIWKTLTPVITVVCIAGLVFVGLKYMWSPAENKAKMKNQAVLVVFGLILTMSALPFVEFLVNNGNNVIK